MLPQEMQGIEPPIGVNQPERVVILKLALLS